MACLVNDEVVNRAPSDLKPFNAGHRQCRADHGSLIDQRILCVLPIAFVFLVTTIILNVAEDPRALFDLVVDEVSLVLDRLSNKGLELLDVLVDHFGKTLAMPVVLKVEFEAFFHFVEHLFTQFNLLLEAVYSFGGQCLLQTVVE